MRLVKIIFRKSFKSLAILVVTLILTSYFYFFLTNYSKYSHIQNENRREISSKKLSKSERSTLFDKIIQKSLNPNIRNIKYLNKLVRGTFGEEFPRDLLVIVVQVNKRVEYLKQLIDSLRHVKDIEQVFLIFSHDYYDEQINRIIESIEYCTNLQIFYPYSLQLYPEKFPGNSPKDCLPNMSINEAIAQNCSNAKNPDMYNHYRDYKIVQAKHHWFWKLVHVFDHLSFTKNIENLDVLLLEEDLYLLPDSLHIYKKLKAIVGDQSHQFISLSTTNVEEPNFFLDETETSKFGVVESHVCHWATVITRNAWKQLKPSYRDFCTYDEYNYDWALEFMAHKAFRGQASCIYPIVSRVLHIGKCGMHHQSNCNSVDMSETRTIIENNIKSLFPGIIYRGKHSIATYNYEKPNGGWGDPRDHSLCKSFVDNSITNLLE